jgi:hypothetical protein
VILPVSVWSEVDPYENVPDEPIEIWPAYEAGDTLAPSVPVTKIVPPESLIVVSPEKEFAPDNVNVPAPNFCNTPVPDTTPAYVKESLRSNFRVPEFTTLCVAIEPVVEPAPALTVPAEIVSEPVNVFAPDKVNVPLPCLVSLPLVPETTPANVVDESLARVSVLVGLPVVLNVTVEIVPSPEVAIDATVSSKPARLKLALFAITTADELEIRSAAPSATVPADTVVVPVYVLSPDNVRVPAPCFVMPKFEPDTTPEIVADLLVSTPTVDVEPSATGPDNSPFSEKYTAPFEDVVPLSVTGSANEPATAISNVAPLVDTEVP